MVWTEEDIEKVRKFINIKNKGHYVETHELTSVYNRVLEKHVNNTSCGSCLRQRVEELERALRRYEADKAKKEAEEIKAQEASEQEEVNNAPQDEKEDDTGQINEEETKEENNDGTEGKSPATAKKRKASKPKTA